MNDEGEWGPWVEHDGKGCPVKGMWVHIVRAEGLESETRATGSFHIMAGSGWIWRSIPKPLLPYRIIRYRVRKPRGLTILKRIAAEPERHKAPEVVG